MTAFLPLLTAAILFAGGHFFLSANGVRPFLAGLFGEKGFKGAYALLMVAALIACVMAFRSAPSVILWDLGSLGRYLAVGIMFFSLLLIVLADFSPNPTAIVGEKLLKEDWQPRGVVTITRHPFLWGTGLGSISHLLANGNMASLILFGGMVILSFGGMLAIDGKRQRKFGEVWQTYAQRTALLPFLGATPVDWRGIGWARLALGSAVFVGIAVIHGWLFNRPVF